MFAVFMFSDRCVDGSRGKTVLAHHPSSLASGGHSFKGQLTRDNYPAALAKQAQCLGGEKREEMKKMKMMAITTMTTKKKKDEKKKTKKSVYADVNGCIGYR